MVFYFLYLPSFEMFGAAILNSFSTASDFSFIVHSVFFLSVLFAFSCFVLLSLFWFGHFFLVSLGFLRLLLAGDREKFTLLRRKISME